MATNLGMLVLTMRRQERVVLRDKEGRLLASLTVARNGPTGNIRLGISAPKGVVTIGRESIATALKPLSEERVSDPYKNGTL